MKRVYSGHAKGTVLLAGWVSSLRDMGNLKFFQLRDREGEIQVTVKKGVVPDNLLARVEDLTREDCVQVIGKVVSSAKAPGGKEVIPTDITVIASAETPLPLETSDKINSGMDKRFDYRFIDARNPKVMALFTIKDRAVAAARAFFHQSGFIEIHTPIIQAAGAEGGSTLFPLIYYKQEAFLRQSPQLYKQILMASGMDKVYEIGPVFRAEKFHTRRHTSEYLSVDGEMSWIDSEEDVMSFIEHLIVYIIKTVKKECKDQLALLGITVTVPKLPFPRITYKEMITTLNKKKGLKLSFGDDLSDPEEKLFGEIMKKKGNDWYFITKYPSEGKPFYIMMDGDISRGFDLDFRGMELISGGQREHRVKKLEAVMKKKKLDPKNFQFYTDAFRYGCPPHGGFGFGIERMIMQLTGVDNLKETILFPRTPERLVP